VVRAYGRRKEIILSFPIFLHSQWQDMGGEGGREVRWMLGQETSSGPFAMV
jgi:hypothetical protein